MGCGASKAQSNNVVETQVNSKSPEKKHIPPVPEPFANKAPIPLQALSEPIPAKPKTPPLTNPERTSTTHVQTNANPIPKPEAPIKLMDAIPNQPEVAKSTPPMTQSSPMRGEIIEINITSKASTPVRSAVQERLEKYAEEKKMAALSRPTTANIERKLADAEERRKAQSEQKLKKVKLKNKDVEERGTQLKELEDRKAQELMLLIKNKNMQANQKRQAIQQEVKTRAEEEAIKAKEVAAKKSASQTPVDTPHEHSYGNHILEPDDAKKSILEIPLPPL